MSKGGVVIVDQQEEATSDLRSSVGGIAPKQGQKFKSAISTGDTIFKQVSQTGNNKSN